MRPHAETIQLLSQKRLIFTVTTGRSGTQYLTRLLRLVPGAVSVHEPRPSYAEVMRQVQQGKIDPAGFLLEEKFPAIIHLLQEKSADIYIETSHLYSKGFLEPTLDMGLVPDMIWLKRSARAVAMSMYRLQTIPGRTPKGLKYYLAPDDPGVLPLPHWQKLHDYQLCYWYCLETERRARRYLDLIKIQGGRVAETSINEIQSTAGFATLRHSLDLPKLTVRNWLRFFKHRSQKANAKKADKEKQEIEIPNLADLETEVESMLQ